MDMTGVAELTCHIDWGNLFEISVTYDTGNADAVDDQISIEKSFQCALTSHQGERYLRLQASEIS